MIGFYCILQLGYQSKTRVFSPHRAHEVYKQYGWWKKKISVICHLWNEKVLRGEIREIKAVLSSARGWLAKLHLARQSSLRHWTSKHSLICCTFGFASGGLFLMVTVPEGRWEYRILFTALHHAIRAICSLLSWCHAAAISPACSGYYSQPLAALIPIREDIKPNTHTRCEKSSLICFCIILVVFHKLKVMFHNATH